jgi:ubiquinone/menaquinone biosynthesis C-methylase UbiE
MVPDVSNEQGGPREADKAAVRSTYAAYDQDHRERLWDRANPGFDRLKTQNERAIVALLRSSLPAGTLTAQALDAGCGEGDLPVLAGHAGISLDWTGIDLLPDRIEVASTRVPGAAFVVGSADALPFADNSFDIVSAITLFSSIPSEQMEAAVAAEVGRVLRPGGWLIWYDLRYDNPGNPAVHGLSGGRLAHLFPGWTRELRSLTVAPPLARRLGRLTPVAYPLLHAVPPLRSHLVGRLRCPA